MGQIKNNIILQPDKLYYLSHPYTGDENKNRESALTYEVNLSDTYEIVIINPLGLPMPNNYEKAMDKCIKLLSACDGMILCPGWENSVGCNMELDYAIDHNIEIIYLERDADE